MKMTLTNIDIVNIMSYVNSDESIARNTTMKFTMEFVWKFRKNIKKLTEANDMFNKLHEEIMNSYATDEFSYVDENGNRMVKQEYLNEYSDKINELYLQENEINVDKVSIEKVCVGGLEGMDQVGVSIPELEVLSFMIDDSEESTGKWEEVKIEDNEKLTGEVE